MSGAPLPTGTVTFLFSDIEGSTDLVRRVGNDAFAAVRTDHRRLLRDAFEAHGGREIDTAGDGFFVAFDSARDAVAAAVNAQLALATFLWPVDAEVRVRMGLHTAEPHLDDDGYVGVGVTRAARICAAAHGGQILVSNATAGIVEDAELPGVELVDLGEHPLHGLPRPQRLFQLAVPGLPSSFGRLRTEAPAPVPGTGTFLLTDVSNWRRVLRLLGDEATGALLEQYYAAMTTLVEAGGGTVFERAGDTTLAVFGDAGAAVRAAAAMREAVVSLAWPPTCDVDVAVVVHSGRWSGDPARPDAGTALYRLGRMSELAEPGQVLVSQTTASLLEGDRSTPPLRRLDERALEDSDDPMQLYELAELAEPFLGEGDERG